MTLGVTYIWGRRLILLQSVEGFAKHFRQFWRDKDIRFCSVRNRSVQGRAYAGIGKIFSFGSKFFDALLIC